VALLCFLTTTTAQINLPSTKIHYTTSGDTLSQPYYRKKYGLNLKNYVNSFKFYNSEVSIPIYYDLTDAEIKKFCKVCKKLFKI